MERHGFTFLDPPFFLSVIPSSPHSLHLSCGPLEPLPAAAGVVAFSFGPASSVFIHSSSDIPSRGLSITIETPLPRRGAHHHSPARPLHCVLHRSAPFFKTLSLCEYRPHPSSSSFCIVRQPHPSASSVLRTTGTSGFRFSLRSNAANIISNTPNREPEAGTLGSRPVTTQLIASTQQHMRGRLCLTSDSDPSHPRFTTAVGSTSDDLIKWRRSRRERECV